MGLFLTAYLGVAISLWPMIVPRRFTLWQATSDASTQAFLLIGTLFLLPVIITYTMWSYWVSPPSCATLVPLRFHDLLVTIFLDDRPPLR